MKKLLITFLIFGSLTIPAFAHAATYYIDYVGGSDSNNGLTTGTAWKVQPYMNGFSGSYSQNGKRINYY